MENIRIVRYTTNKNNKVYFEIEIKYTFLWFIRYWDTLNHYDIKGRPSPIKFKSLNQVMEVCNFLLDENDSREILIINIYS